MAAVRSCECDRTSPPGARQAAYVAFLSGLPQPLAASDAEAWKYRHGSSPPSPLGHKVSSTMVGWSPPAQQSGCALRPHTQHQTPFPATRQSQSPYTWAQDMVRSHPRATAAAAAAGVWTVFLHCMITTQPPHM